MAAAMPQADSFRVIAADLRLPAPFLVPAARYRGLLAEIATAIRVGGISAPRLPRFRSARRRVG
jgi:hypothetical protein